MERGPRDYAKLGDHWYICDICGQKTWQSDSRVTWNGFLACISRGCWFPKHAADIPLPVIPDPKVLPAQTMRPDLSDWDNLPTLPNTGWSTWSTILPPMNILTWSQQTTNYANFDEALQIGIAP